MYLHLLKWNFDSQPNSFCTYEQFAGEVAFPKEQGVKYVQS